MSHHHEETLALLKSAGRMRQWVDSGRTVLVCQYPDGTMTVALRDSPAHLWGPPVTVRLEQVTE